MEDDELLKAFGRKVKEIRAAKGLSQEEVSFGANLDRVYISMIERGIKNITLRNIQKIASGLEVPMAELFKDLEKDL